FMRMCSSSSHHSYTPPLAVDTPRVSTPSKTIVFPKSRFKPSLPLDVGGLDSASEALCGANGTRHGQLICADVEALVTALLAHDCDESAGRVREVRKVLHEKPPGPDSRFLNQVFLARWQLCGGMKQLETE